MLCFYRFKEFCCFHSYGISTNVFVHPLMHLCISCTHKSVTNQLKCTDINYAAQYKNTVNKKRDALKQL